MTTAEKINILVVDDVPEKLVAMQAILDELGQRIVTASSGREALRRLLEEDFAVILLDVNMPGMDGFETAALIRSRKKSEQIPIIFVTAFGDETHVTQGYSLGAVDYILTPVMPEVLRAKVSVFVELFRKTEQIELQANQRIALIREQAARAAAEETTRRSNFLSEASTLLARSLDYEATISNSMRLAVPLLAEFVALSVSGDRAGPVKCEIAWLDPSTREVRHSPEEIDSLPLSLSLAMERVSLSGRSELIANPETHRTALPEDKSSHKCFEYSSAVVIPLQARGRTLGVFSLAVGSSARSYRPGDVTLAEDLAGRVALAIDNARLYREIQEGDRRKNEFLAMLGHELRNPLAAICNAVDCLALVDDSRSLAEDMRQVLARQVHQMTRLVDDLLDVSRITRGKIELRKEVVDLGLVISGAVATTKASIAARQHELSVSAPVERILLQADPARLEQILANLLQNAAKYTEVGGHIWLIAECAANQIVLRVRDDGIGIPSDLFPNIFDLFAQGDRSLDRTQGGLGIGLTLVRSLVELHGGRIEAFSEGTNCGSEFTIYLPRQRVNEFADASPPTLGTGTSLIAPAVKSRRILLVDDNSDLVTSLAAMLRNDGHQVHVAYDGLSAIEVARRTRPEVILVDIGLPEMDGYEVARQLRSHADFDQIVLVAVTGYGQLDDRRRAQEAGFNCHLVKPLPFEKLQELLADLELLAQGQHELAERFS